ncbi:MAG: DpnD/PcfM family protein [Clostridia bacterium]
MKYIIEVTETLTRQIEVNSDSKSEAINIIKQQYKDEEIVLDESNFVDVDFVCLEN